MIDFDEQTFEDEPQADQHAAAREHADVRARLALQMLKAARDSMNHVISLLEEGDAARASRQLVQFVSQRKAAEAELGRAGVRSLEGVFDGQAMVGGDGARYPVPENYASKSKLVEGDMLKLMIREDGSFVFKQIGPAPRRRLTGTLEIDPSTQEPIVRVADDVYKVLAASVSYLKGATGDEVVIVVPSGGRCVWAAIERLRL